MSTDKSINKVLDCADARNLISGSDNKTQCLKLTSDVGLEHAYNEIKDRKCVMHNGCFIKNEI